MRPGWHGTELLISAMAHNSLAANQGGAGVYSYWAGLHKGPRYLTPGAGQIPLPVGHSVHCPRGTYPRRGKKNNKRAKECRWWYLCCGYGTRT